MFQFLKTSCILIFFCYKMFSIPLFFLILKNFELIDIPWER
jgi:hypothetical protein